VIIIGVTGSLSTGKTTVASMFAHLGAQILDADRIAHRLLQKDRICIKKIIGFFGDSVMTRNRIDKGKLAAIVFKNKKHLDALEKIIHPCVIKEIKEKIKYFRAGGRKKVVILDVPLLYESGLSKLSDFNITVWVPQKIQLQRILKNTEMSRREALARIRCQMPLRQKCKLSDFIIDNQGARQRTRKQVTAIWDQCVI